MQKGKSDDACIMYNFFFRCHAPVRSDKIISVHTKLTMEKEKIKCTGRS